MIALKMLIKDMQEAMLASLQETNGVGEISIRRNFVGVTTQPSRDYNRSRNGGEYDYFRNYTVVANGVLAKDSWSCDFSDYSKFGGTENLYEISIRNLENVGKLAELRARALWHGMTEEMLEACSLPFLKLFVEKMERNRRFQRAIQKFTDKEIGFYGLKHALQELKSS